MVATAQVPQEDGIQAADVYRLSVEQYHQMILSGILREDDPVELLQGLLLNRWPTRTSDGVGLMFYDEFYPLSVHQYHEMGRLNILTEEDRVELLEGVLVRKMTKKDPHIEATRRCRRAIEPLLPSGRFYETEQPIILANTEPEPDGVVIIGSAFEPRLMKPKPADIELVIEVSERSLSIDRTVKLRSYARAGITRYWIINLIDRQIEVYMQPNASASVPAFDSVQIFNPEQSVPLIVDGKLISEIAVRDLLPTVVAP